MGTTVDLRKEVKFEKYIRILKNWKFSQFPCSVSYEVAENNPTKIMLKGEVAFGSLDTDSGEL